MRGLAGPATLENGRMAYRSDLPPPRYYAHESGGVRRRRAVGCAVGKTEERYVGPMTLKASPFDAPPTNPQSRRPR